MRSLTTDVSGRGVGMDVVKSVVVRLGGAVRVHSEAARGTTITLDLPLSLALLRVVLVESGAETFALPTAAVRRILHVAPAEIAQRSVDVGGVSVPLVALRTLFGRVMPLAA